MGCTVSLGFGSLRRRLTALLAAALLVPALAALLTSCAGTISQAELVGSWVHQEPSTRVAELDLKSDGSMSVSGVPREVLIASGSKVADLNWTDSIEAEGTWSVAEDGSVTFDLTLDDGSFLSGSLYPFKRGDEITIEAQLTASDLDAFVFRRSVP